MRSYALTLAGLICGCQCGGHVSSLESRLAVSPSSLDFSTLLAGATATRTVSLENTGNAALQISAIHIDADTRGAFALGSWQQALPSGTAQMLSVTYVAPAEPGTDTATLVIESDADDMPMAVVSLSGRSITGCCALDGGDDAGPVDGGTDAGVTMNDGGADAGPFDAGQPDDAGMDGGVPDSGVPDSGVPDAGMPPSDGGHGLPDASYCGIDGDFHVSLQLTTQYANPPVLTWNGATYGATWVERPQAGTTFNVFFSLMSPLGAPLTAAQQVSPSNGLSHAQPRVAFDGSSYNITYYENLSSSPYYRDLFGRVDGSGTPAAGSTIPLLPSGSIQYMPAIAWNPLDGELGVAWAEAPGGTNPPATLYFARIKDGAVVGSPIPLRNGIGIFMSDEGSHVLIWTGTQYALTWTEGSALYVGEISRAGALIATSLTQVPTGGADRPVLDFDGAHYGVAYMDYAASQNELHFALVNAGGGYVAASNTLVGVPGTYSGDPDIAWNGSNFTLVFDQGAPMDIWTARVTSSGALVAGSRHAISCGPDDWAFPSLTWNGSVNAVTYIHFFGSPQQSEQELVLFP